MIKEKNLLVNARSLKENELIPTLEHTEAVS